MCLFAATKTGRLFKKPQCESLNFWTHHDVFFFSPLPNQSFAAGNPDTCHWMRGMTPHSGMGTSRQRAYAVVEKTIAVAQVKARTTAWMAATNPTPRARSCNTGNVFIFTHHSWSAASTGGSFRRQEVERGSMAECIIGI